MAQLLLEGARLSCHAGGISVSEMWLRTSEWRVAGAGRLDGLEQISSPCSSAVAGRCLKGWLQLVALRVPGAELGAEPTRGLGRGTRVLCQVAFYQDRLKSGSQSL